MERTASLLKRAAELRAALRIAILPHVARLIEVASGITAATAATEAAEAAVSAASSAHGSAG